MNNGFFNSMAGQKNEVNWRKKRMVGSVDQKYQIQSKTEKEKFHFIGGGC